MVGAPPVEEEGVARAGPRRQMGSDLRLELPHELVHALVEVGQGQLEHELHIEGRRTVVAEP